jgi:hypothetical protein
MSASTQMAFTVTATAPLRAPVPEPRRVTDCISAVEQALRACPQVHDVLVTERADRPPGRNLVAYVACAADAPQSAGRLRAQLLQTLAPELVPATLVTLDAMPLLADGSCDQAALRALDARSLGVRVFEVPEGAVERALAAIWQDLLGLDHVGRNAHFFELGGHSSLAVRMVYQVQQSMQVSVAMRELFHHPVLHQFAAVVGEYLDAATLARRGPVPMLPA